MRLLEHEAKAILKAGKIPVPKSILFLPTAKTPAAFFPIVLKSQVPVGGRGKAGGVIVVDHQNELQSTLKRLFSLAIKNHQPHSILGEEKLAIKKELYLSLFVDRDKSAICLMAHKGGGVDVEAHSASEFLTLTLDNTSLKDCAAQLAGYLGYPVASISPLLKNLYTTFVKNDATLLEVNPLVVTEKDNFVCGDCKMELDNAAAFRHPEWQFEDSPQDANFVSLNPNGTIATIANGAGLAMATVDSVAANGMLPANFLDIGGGANTESVLNAFRKINEFPNIKAIVINIFAGITRCDEVAKAVIQAKKQLASLPPLFIRLAGTNFEEAVALLAAEDITTLASLEECLKAAKDVAHG